MEVSRDDVVLLVGAEERLAVVDEVADERGRQEREVGEEDDAHLELGGREDERQAGPEHQAGAEDDEPDPAVEVAEDGDDLVDLRLVVVEKGLVEHIADGAANAQLRQVEKAEQVLQRGGQPDEVSPQRVEKDFP